MIVKAKTEDLEALEALVSRLWPDHDPQELARTLGQEDAAFFLAMEPEGAVGFAQCQLRRDYVEGTEHSPVGYLEGIFVAEEHRCRGVAKDLLRACERWAAEMGCGEFASDCELENTVSQRFHERMGFREANRIVCFVKSL